MSQDIITSDGEIVEQGALTVLSGGLVAELAKAEIAQQVATARQYPRSIKRASTAIKSLATLDEDAATDCIYALPRGGKPIRGPSIRLAEVVAQQWGNNRVATRVIEIDRVEKILVAEAVFHDLETNAAVKTTVRRRISNGRGQILSDDMIVVTGNAASSIARRNAILAGVPKAVWNPAYLAAEGVVKGDVKTLAERRGKAIASFGTWGVKPEQIFGALNVAGEDEITLEHLPTLIGMFQAIKNGEESVESLFTNRTAAAGKPFEKVANPLADDAPSAGGTTSAGPGFGETGGPAGEGAGRAAAAAPAPEQPTKSETAAEPPGESGEVREDLAAYRKAGFDAGRLGRAKSLPRDLRGDENAEAADAWLEGHDEGRAAAGGEG